MGWQSFEKQYSRPSPGAKDELPKKLGFAWVLGFGTLYKFMSFTLGELRDRVVDVIENSHIYCLTPDLFQ